MLATVYKSTGSWYKIKTEDGAWLNARTAGKLRLKGIKSTNPIAVGDLVEIRIEKELENQAIIIGIEDRKNYLVRKSNKLSKHSQVLAANIDLLLIIASLKEPETSLGFIDRCTVSAIAYNVKPIICFNKTDIWDEADWGIFKELLNIYSKASIEVIHSSCYKEGGMEALKETIKLKRVLLSGHSGVGKSSILNALNPKIDAKVGAISQTQLRGKHTTTFAEMFELDGDTQVIDTPGIRDFGIIDITAEELPNYFPEMFGLLGQCKYYNCKHINEPECAVINALQDESVPSSRYHSYLSILENDNVFD